MIFDSRKNLELTDNYVGGRRCFEIKTEKNGFVECWDTVFESGAYDFRIELNVLDFVDRTYNHSVHVAHCSLVWYNYYFDESGAIADCEARCPSSGQILASYPYYGNINSVKSVCKELRENVRWFLSEKDFLIVNRAILAAFEDFCKVYYK